jgi:hypothetical protein
MNRARGRTVVRPPCAYAWRALDARASRQAGGRAIARRPLPGSRRLRVPRHNSDAHTSSTDPKSTGRWWSWRLWNAFRVPTVQLADGVESRGACAGPSRAQLSRDRWPWRVRRSGRIGCMCTRIPHAVATAFRDRRAEGHGAYPIEAQVLRGSAMFRGHVTAGGLQPGRG